MIRAVSRDTLIRRVQRFLADTRGVSAVEFALVLPLMLTLLIGGSEVGDGVATKLKMSRAAYTVADLTSQFVSIQSSDMSNILGAGSVLIAPYASTHLTVTVSEVKTTAPGGIAAIKWSASTGTARAAGQVMTLPPAFSTLPVNTTLILGEASYAYTPTLGYSVTGTFTFSDSYYMYPRLSDCVTYNNVC